MRHYALHLSAAKIRLSFLCTVCVTEPKHCHRKSGPFCCSTEHKLLTLRALMVPRVRPGTSAQLRVSVPGSIFACLWGSLGSICLSFSRMALLCPNAFADCDTELWYSLPPPRLTAEIERIVTEWFPAENRNQEQGTEPSHVFMTTHTFMDPIVLSSISWGFLSRTLYNNKLYCTALSVNIWGNWCAVP